MRKRWLALALAGVLTAAPALGLAETAAVFDPTPVQPLLDAVTSAALDAEEPLELLTEEALPEDFIPRLLGALEACGLSADAQTLGDLLAMPLPAEMQEPAQDVALLPLRVLTADMSEEGDAVMLVGEVVLGETHPEARHVVVELHQDADSPVGWKLYRFTLNDSALLEAVSGSGLTVEYVNTACGYSIQYPALFAQEQITEIPGGIQAALPDDSASFSVSRQDNADSLTLEALLARESVVNPGTQTSVHEPTGSGLCVYQDETDVTHVVIYQVSEAYVYQAELNYFPEREAEFAPYVRYMLNSFSADELGLG